MDPSGPDTSALHAYADQLQARFKTLTEEGPAIQEKAKAVQITETSDDGLISATVGARGELIRLDIDPRIYRHPDSLELADTITETVKRAGTKAQERVVELFSDIIPRAEVQRHLAGDTDGVLDNIANQMLGKE